MRIDGYKGTVYRPPVEADTFLLPVTEGCSHNSCKFCSMYMDIPFRMCDLTYVVEKMRAGAQEYHANGRQMDRVYLVGADPFVLSADRMQVIADLIRKYAPECQTITMYAAVRNMIKKSDADLTHLKEMGVNDLYVGMETALPDVLDYINKGNSAEELKTQLLRLNRLGIRHREMIMIGVAGKGRGVENALACAEFFNEIKPDMILINTMAPFPGTELYKEILEGKFELADEKEVLIEERTLLENLNLPGTYFWAAHPMNYLMIEGQLDQDKESMLATLDDEIWNMEDAEYMKEFRRISL